MAVLKAIVSDKDGIIHELLLVRRGQNAGYRWCCGSTALIDMPAASPEEAVRILKQKIAPTPDDRVQLIRLTGPGDR